MALKLDARDVKILAILQEEGRYGARIALELFAEHVTVFVTAELENHRSEDFGRFEDVVGKEPEIIGCWALGGGLDYLFQVVTSNVTTYQRLIDRLLESEAGLKRYYSYIVTKEVKAGGAIPVELFTGG